MWEMFEGKHQGFWFLFQKQPSKLEKHLLILQNEGLGWKSNKIKSEGKSMRGNVGKIGKFIFPPPDTRNIWQFFTAACTDRIQNQYRLVASFLELCALLNSTFHCVYAQTTKKAPPGGFTFGFLETWQKKWWCQV